MVKKSKTTLYKGVVIFGAPGTGKTTIAKSLMRAIPSARHIEASERVIYPAFSKKDKLPKTEKDFFSTILRSGKRIEDKPSREDARNFFVYLKNRFSGAIVAKTILYIHQKECPDKFLIVSGIRGYRNAMFFKKNGYYVIYLESPSKVLMSRVSRRESFLKKDAEVENRIEERLFSTNRIGCVAHHSFNTAHCSQKNITNDICHQILLRECKNCVNTNRNIACVIGASGLCDTCEAYKKYFNKKILKKELDFFLSLRNMGDKKYDVLVGISGGKDSTAMLYEVKRMGFAPLAFTLDSGYYPKHIFVRAKNVARELGIDFEKINIQKYMRPVDRASFQKTAELYSKPDSEELREIFKKWYKEGRRHYSIKCSHTIPFVRTCQLCRRLVVRAYYGEAVRHGARAVVVGINEWAGLSQSSDSKKIIFSGIRKLQPTKKAKPVYVIHLPFLLQRKISETENILRMLGWKIPRGERLVESNANSCLFARAAENKARRMLGFHPDSTRLAREVTVGFITKKQARRALEKKHNSKKSVRAVLKNAGVL